MKPITVLLADDHMIVREGIRILLGAETDLAVVGEAKNGREAVTMAGKLHPNVIVMDIAMPQLNGLEATRQIHEAAPATKVLILSAHSDDGYVEQALASGASGFLVKASSASMVAQAIREVHKGKQFYCPSVSNRLARRKLQAAARDGAPGKKAAALTSREAEVLQLIAEGSTNKAIASELGISIKTVEKHREHLMDKLDIHDTAGLTRHAITAGIIEASVQF